MNDIKAAVNTRFSGVAENYSTSAVHAAGEDLAKMVEAGALTGTERVLDAGCGAGHTALIFAPHAAEVVAYDLSTQMLGQVSRLAEERELTNVRTQKGDVEKLPYDDATFDVVTSRYSAHHWPNPQQAIHEIHRVLKPGGQFLLGDIVSWDEHAIDTFLQALELLRDTSHVRDHSIHQWQGMFAEAGFAQEQISVAYEWRPHMDFPVWIKRIGTPPDNEAMIKTLFDGASSEVRTAFQVEEDYSFRFKGAILKAVKSE